MFAFLAPLPTFRSAAASGRSTALAPCDYAARVKRGQRRSDHGGGDGSVRGNVGVGAPLITA
jgi:hypothetical protein